MELVGCSRELRFAQISYSLNVYIYIYSVVTRQVDSWPDAYPQRQSGLACWDAHTPCVEYLSALRGKVCFGL